MSYLFEIQINKLQRAMDEAHKAYKMAAEQQKYLLKVKKTVDTCLTEKPSILNTHDTKNTIESAENELKCVISKLDEHTLKAVDAYIAVKKYLPNTVLIRDTEQHLFETSNRLQTNRETLTDTPSFFQKFDDRYKQLCGAAEQHVEQAKREKSEFEQEIESLRQAVIELCHKPPVRQDDSAPSLCAGVLIEAKTAGRQVKVDTLQARLLAEETTSAFIDAQYNDAVSRIEFLYRANDDQHALVVIKTLLLENNTEKTASWITNLKNTIIYANNKGMYSVALESESENNAIRIELTPPAQPISPNFLIKAMAHPATRVVGIILALAGIAALGLLVAASFAVNPALTVTVSSALVATKLSFMGASMAAVGTSVAGNWLMGGRFFANRKIKNDNALFDNLASIDDAAKFNASQTTESLSANDPALHLSGARPSLLSCCV